MPANTIGGSNILKLQVNHLPPHIHKLGVTAFYHKYGGGDFHGMHYAPDGGFEMWYDASS